MGYTNRIHLWMVATIIAICPVITGAQTPCAVSQSFKIVVVGSSTAAGTGPSSSDSAWVNRYRKYLQGINPSNQVVNLAVGGTTTYHIMPTGFTPSLGGRPSPNTQKNITMAISLNPDAIIINMPSNDASFGFGPTEQLYNFDSLKSAANLAGIPVWICTTQPRNGFDAVKLQWQKDVKDSILARYGSKAIDFWTTLATATGNIEPPYNAGDGIHLNNAGHRILFNRAKDVNILAALCQDSVTTNPNQPDYDISGLNVLNYQLCSDSSLQWQVIVSNLQDDDTSDIIVTFKNHLVNTNLTQIFTQVISGGLTSGTSDTLYFSASHDFPGEYIVSAIVSAASDQNHVNDSSAHTLNVVGKPTLSLFNDTVCPGFTASLLAAAKTNDVINWYDQPSGGTLFHTGNSYNVPLLTSGSETYYVEAVRGSMAVTENKTLSTTFNSTHNWNGAMFDLIALEDMVLDSFAIKMFTTGSQVVDVYMKQGSHKGHESNAASWSVVRTGTVNVSTAGQIVHLNLNSLPLSGGDTAGIYIKLRVHTGKLSYTQTNQEMIYGNDELKIVAGTGITHGWGATYFPRIWNGSVFYHFNSGNTGACTSDRKPVTAVATAPPVPSLGADTSLAFNDSLLITPGNFASYEWSTGDSTQTILFKASDVGIGLHTVSVSVWNAGCFGSDTLMIEVLPEPVDTNSRDTLDYGILSSGTLNYNICGEENLLWQIVIGNSDTVPGNEDVIVRLQHLLPNNFYNYYYDTIPGGLPANSSDTIYFDIDATEAGNHQFNALIISSINTIDLNPLNDSSSSEIIIAEDPLPSLGSNTTLLDSLTLFPGNFMSYQWSTADTTPEIVLYATSLGSGVHEIWVNVTDTNGCQGSDTIYVDVLPSVISDSLDIELVSIQPLNFSICGDSAMTWEATYANNKPGELIPIELHIENILLPATVTDQDTVLLMMDSIGSTDFTTNNLLPGNYKLRVWVTTNEIDTLASNDTLEYTYEILGTPQLTVMNDTICEGQTAGLSASSLPGDDIKWFDAPSAGNLLVNGNNFTTPVLNNSNTYYVQGSRGTVSSITNGSLQTTYNSTHNWNGVMFDLIAAENIVMDSFAIKMFTTGSQVVDIYMKQGTHKGHESNPASWTVVRSGTVNVTTAGQIVYLNLNSLPLNDGDTAGIYIKLRNHIGKLSYTQTSQEMTYGNSELQIVAGTGVTHGWGATYFPRIWNGAVSYHYGSVSAGQCVSERKPVTALVAAQPLPQLGTDTTIFENDSLLLNPGNFNAYLWSDSSVTNTLKVFGNLLGTGFHRISVEVENTTGCSAADTMMILVLPSPEDSTVVEDTVELSLHATGELNVPVCGHPEIPWQVVISNNGNVNVELVSIQLSVIHEGDTTITLLAYSEYIDAGQQDTTELEFPAMELGAYKVIARIIGDTSYHDLVKINDTISATFEIMGTPALSVINDTVCKNNMAELTAITGINDYVRWFDGIPGTNVLHEGSGFITPALNESKTYYAEAVRGSIAVTEYEDLSTTFNSTHNWNGVMFDLIAAEDLVLDSFAFKMFTTGSQVVDVYMKQGSHKGHESNAASWTVVRTGTVNVTSTGQIVRMALNGLTINQGETAGIYLKLRNHIGKLSYTLTNQEMTYGNDELQIVAGTGITHGWGATYFPRIWNGTVFYHYSSGNQGGTCFSEKLPVNAYVDDTSPDLGPDVSIGEEDSIVLNAGNFDEYDWSTGSISSSVLFRGQDFGPGSHAISVTVVTGNECEASDSIVITVVSGSVAKTTLNGETKTFTVYPNPASGQFTIELNELAGGHLAIYNQLGSTVFERDYLFDKKSAQKTLLHFSDWPEGYYIIRFTGPAGVSVEKLVINR